LLTVFPLALGAVGLASLNVSPWSIVAAIGGPFVLLSAASASVTLMLARRAEAREFADATEERAEGTLAPGEARELPGGTDALPGAHASARRGDRVHSDPA
jgi:hypothetical protein